MVDLVVIALLSVGIGCVVWAVDRRNSKYGALVPSAVALAGALLTWILTVAAGLGYHPGLTWVPWVASLVVGAIASVAVSRVLGTGRQKHDVAHLTAILRGR